MDFIEENSYNTETPTCGTQWGLASQAPGGGRGWGWRHSSSTGLVGAWSGILLGVVVGMYLFSACRINSWPSSIFLVLIITTREPALDATQQFNCTPKIDYGTGRWTRRTRECKSATDYSKTQWKFTRPEKHSATAQQQKSDPNWQVQDFCTYAECQ